VIFYKLIITTKVTFVVFFPPTLASEKWPCKLMR